MTNTPVERSTGPVEFETAAYHASNAVPIAARQVAADLAALVAHRDILNP